VDEVLLIAGGMAPVGEFHETVQILESGCLEEAGIRRVGVAGHPEGHPDVADDLLTWALAAKNRIARERGLDMYLVTQFTFAAEPVVAWERRLRAMGNTLPIHVGLPGVTSPAKLIKFGLSCGVGPSLSVLRKQTGGVLKLATTTAYKPEDTLLDLAAAIAADPRSLLSTAHFFPFGALSATAEWAYDLRARNTPRSERSA
jgi:methylenetetrahydrofolate reductase (NADPH)